MAREKGVVKWFSTDKGYGFIRRESGEEIFVHHTDIEVDGYASLKNGETVEFDVFESDRGPKARNLVPLESGSSQSQPATGKAAAERGESARGKSRADSSKGRGRNASRASRDRQSRNDSARGAADGKKPLAAQLRERLRKRFPGLGG
jgi:CspA family cold shock protein